MGDSAAKKPPAPRPYLRFGARLRELRGGRPLLGVSAESDIPPSTLGNYEAGRVAPVVPRLRDLAAVLGADPDALVALLASVAAEVAEQGGRVRRLRGLQTTPGLPGRPPSRVYPYSTFGAELRVRRREKKIALSALAEALGITTDSLSHYERGKMLPRVDRLQGLAAALDLSPETLIAKAGAAAAQAEAAGERRQSLRGSGARHAAAAPRPRAVRPVRSHLPAKPAAERTPAAPPLAPAPVPAPPPARRLARSKPPAPAALVSPPPFDPLVAPAPSRLADEIDELEALLGLKTPQSRPSEARP